MSAGGAAQLVQPAAATLRSGPAAGTGRSHRGVAARPRRSTDVGDQRRLPAQREDVPGQHRPALPANPGGREQLTPDLFTYRIFNILSFLIIKICLFFQIQNQLIYV